MEQSSSEEIRWVANLAMSRQCFTQELSIINLLLRKVAMFSLPLTVGLATILCKKLKQIGQTLLIMSNVSILGKKKKIVVGRIY
jgi:hypothetical protein